jgi:type I restriction enzyme S subunit
MSTTRLVKLGDLIEVHHGYAFESAGFQESGEFALLTPGNFHEEGGFRRQGTQQKRYAGVVEPKWILKPGAILVAMTEQAAGLLGAAIRIPEDDQWLHNQRMGLVEIKCPDRLCAGYLYHWFNSASARKLIPGAGEPRVHRVASR